MTLRIRLLPVLAAAAILTVGGCGHGDRIDRAAPPPGSSGAPTTTPTEAEPPAPTAGTSAEGRTDAGVPGPAAASIPPTRAAAAPTIDSDPACRPQVLQEATAAATGGQTVT